MYKLVGTNNIMSPVNTVLENRGIKDIEKFLNPSKQDEIHYSNLKNISEAAKMFDSHKSKDSEFAIVVDSDADGYTSAAILICYMRKMFPDIKHKYYMHDGRENGLTEKIMERLLIDKPSIVLTPDASSSDFQQHETLKSMGIDVISLDHHETDRESENAIIVNPHLSPKYENTAIAGVGVTYKFLQALDEYYGFGNASEEYLSLVSFGNVTDSIDMTSPETRYYVYEGFKNLNNTFLKQLLFKNAGWSKEYTPKIISFDVAPKFNALIRVGKNEEKMDVFRAMLGEEEEYYNTRTKRTETLPEKAVRLCTNAYAKLAKIRKTLAEEIKLKVEREKLNSNAFLVVKLEDFQKGLSGYIAGNLVGTYRKPVLILSWNENQKAYMGSLRGHDSTVSNTKTFLTSLGLFNYIAGHEQAAGISISSENLDKLNDAINEKLQFVNTSQPIEVDFKIHSRNLNLDLVKEFAKYDKYWGKNVSEPVLVVTDVELQCGDFQFGNTMKGTKNGIEVFSFTVDSRIEQLAEDNKTIVCDIVGSLGVNHFLGKTTPQIKVSKIDIKETKETARFVF